MELTGLMALVCLALLSVLAFWRPNAVLFMVLAAAGISLGLAAPDVMSSEATTTPLDLTITISLIGYGLMCSGWAFKLMFWREEA